MDPLVTSPLFGASRRRRALLQPLIGAATLAPVLLAGCAADSRFPSLAKRPAELVAEGRIARSALPAAPAPPALNVPHLALPADLPGRVAALGAQARAAHALFQDKRAGAARAVGGGSTTEPGAMVALADLSSARSQTAVSLAELDQLYIAERIDGGDGQTIAAVRDQVTAWVADEDAVLADLEGRLKS
jgi:hypothetical protein